MPPLGGGDEADGGAPLTPLEKVQRFVGALASDREFVGHDSKLNVGKEVTILSVSLPPETPYPTVTYRLTVTAAMSNRIGNLHGGMSATIFDLLTSVALPLVAREGAWHYGGVSRSLNVTYLRPAPVGIEVDVKAEVVNAGARLVCLHGTMTRASDGVVLASCTHDKVNTDPPVGSPTTKL